MYEERFNLSGSPFRLNPDPKFFFGSRSHNKAMAYLHYGLRQGEGFIVITGEIGAGKSMLISHMLDQLDHSNVAAAQLLTPNLPPQDLLAHILSAYRIEPSGAGKAADFEAFEDFLFDQMNRGKRVLLIVDEAQSLPVDTLEQLRILSNMNYEGTPLFQVFLIGQPDFRDLLADAGMEQVRQRIIASYHLNPLTVEEAQAYVEHRLSVVGWSGAPSFAGGAFQSIHRATGGLPRKINTLCNRLFLYCALENRDQIDAIVVETVAAELEDERPKRAEKPAEAPGLAAPHAAANKLRAIARAKTDAGGAGPTARVEERSMTQTNGAMSVLDRLKSARSAGAPDIKPGAAAEPILVAEFADDAAAEAEPIAVAAVDAPPAPQSATLDEVADAIMAASRGVSAEAEIRNDEPASENDDDGDHDRLTTAANADPSQGWRRSVTMSVADAREDLKQAHVSVARLSRRLSDIDRRRTERRGQIVASLERAESLLGELRRSFR